MGKINVLFIILLLLCGYITDSRSIDIIAPQWFYLSVVNVLILIYQTIYYETSSISLLKLKEKPISILTVYFLFTITSLISIIVAYNKIESLISFSTLFISWVTLYNMYSIGIKLKNNKIFLILLVVLIYVELFSSFYPILKDYVNQNLSYRKVDYAKFGANVNITAFSIILKTPILIYFFIIKKGILKNIVGYFSFIIICTTLFILGSRGALISIFVIFILLTVYHFLIKKDIIKGIKIFSLLIILVGVNYLISTPEINTTERLSNLTDTEEDFSVNSRVRFYTQAFNVFKKNPILGIGLGNWKIESIKQDKENIYEFIVPYHAHNDFLQILAETGILPFLLYLSFFILLIYSALKSNTDFGLYLCCAILIYIFDSSINFPISRSISQINLMLLASTILLLKRNE